MPLSIWHALLTRCCCHDGCFNKVSCNWNKNSTHSVPWCFPKSDLCDLRGKDAEGNAGQVDLSTTAAYATTRKNQPICHKVLCKIVWLSVFCDVCSGYFCRFTFSVCIGSFPRKQYSSSLVLRNSR